MIEKFANIVVTKSRYFITFAVLLFALSAWQLPKLYFEDSTDMWFLKDDQMALTYKNYKRTFQSDEFLTIAINKRPGDQDVFNSETLRLIRSFTEFLDEHRNVTKVRSLSRYQYMHTSSGILKIDNVIPEDEDEFKQLSAKDWTQIRAIMQKEHLSEDLIVAADYNSTIISARVIESDVNRNARLELAQDFNQYIIDNDLTNIAWDIHLLGAATINENYFRYSESDSQFIYPVMFVIIFVLLVFLFRTLAGVVLPILLVIFSIIMTLGIAAYLGWSLNMLNIVLPLLLMVISLADSIHIMVSFYNYRQLDYEPKEAAKKTIKTLFIPCFYTTITTFVGFIALAASKLVPVIQFGIEAAIGVLIAFVLSITVLPAILVHIKGFSRLGEVNTRIINLLPKFAYKHSMKITLIALILIPAATYFARQINIDTSFERNFKQNSDIRKSIRFYENNFAGALGLEMVLDSGKAGGAKEPQFLLKTLALQEWLESQDCCSRTLSLNDYLFEINAKLNEHQSQYYTVPNSRELVSQYLLLYSNGGPEEDLTDMISNDESKIRLSVTFKSRPAKQTSIWINKIKAELATNYQDLNATLTGRTIMFNNMDKYIQNGLISSFSLAFLLIILSFFILFKSVKYGILAMFTSMLPVLVVGGIMGAFDIYLDFATMMVAAVTIGIAVDDSIHFLWHYVNTRRSGSSRNEAIEFAVKKAGRAIIFTSIILASGFLMLMFSAFIPTIFFGILGAIVVVFALLADLLFLPAFMYLNSHRKKQRGHQNLQTHKLN
jgi:predicted RND superfamily exporter protein